MSCVASRARAKSQAMQIDHGELLIQPMARAYPEVFLNYIEEKWRQTQSFLCKTTLLGFYPPAFKDTTIMIPPGDAEKSNLSSTPFSTLRLDKELKTGNSEADTFVHASVSNVAMCPQLDG